MIEDYTYLRQTISVKPAHEKYILKKIVTAWSTIGRHSNIMNNNLPPSLKRM